MRSFRVLLMPRLKILGAWGVAACAFAAAAAAIMATRPMFIGRATAEISRTEISPEGLATFSRVEISGTNRMLPTEIVTRLYSHGTIRRALQMLHLPADDAAVADVAGRIAVRLIAGTTVIESVVRSDTAEEAPALAGTLFTAHDAILRERRAALTDSLLASLDGAMDALRKESQSVAHLIGEMELTKPAGEGRYNREMDRAFVDVASEKARIRATLQRLEAIESSGLDRQVRELDDVARTTDAEHPFTGLAGYEVLRAGIAAKLSELAQRRVQHGENSALVQSTRAEISALHEALRSYLAGQVTQLRAQLSATESAGDTIDARAKAKLERSKAIQVARVSPVSEALLLRREAIRTQLGKMELRRRELLVFKEVYAPSLSLLDPPRVSDAPEVAQRNARLVFAAFGALLIGVSLSIISGRRSLAVM